MNGDNMVSVVRVCECYGIEPTVIEELSQQGLLEVITEGKDLFIVHEQVGQLEKLLRLHFELEINFAGVAAILHLLERNDELQRENQRLRNQLRRFAGE